MNIVQKHVGRVANTGANCVVVFIQLPDDPENALIVEAESLPPKYSDLFAEAVLSREAQDSPELSKVLNRKMFSDGTSMLNTLHREGYLVKMPIDNITMLPLKNQAVKLRIIVDAMDKAKGVTPKKTKKTKGSDPIKEDAKNKIEEARKLEAKAKALRGEAYELNPKLSRSKKVKA